MLLSHQYIIVWLLFFYIYFLIVYRSEVCLLCRIRNSVYNKVNQTMMCFPKCVTALLFGSRVAIVLFLVGNFALYCIQRLIGFYMNLSCKLVFLNAFYRKIRFSSNFSCRVVFFNQLFTVRNLCLALTFHICSL